MTEQLKKQIEKASDKVRDFLEQQDGCSAGEIKKKFDNSLKKTAQHLEEMVPSQSAGLCQRVKAQPVGAVLLSLLTGFILGRISK